MTRVTIVIRAKNEQQLIGQCLDGIAAQRTTLTADILLIDSGSTDRTLEIARRYPRTKIYEISPQDFNYGATINRGIKLATGNFIILLSAHCVPVDASWLDKLANPLLDDPTLAATFSRQLPWPNCSLFERNCLQSAFPEEPSVTRRVHNSSKKFEVVFSNASCCIRRELALSSPFLPLEYAEDRVWATKMIVDGFGIAYVPESAVYHSHPWSPLGRYRIALKTGIAMRATNESPPDVNVRQWLSLPRIRSSWQYWLNQARRHSQSKWYTTFSAAKALSDQITTDVGFARAARLSNSRITQYKASVV